MLSVWVGVPNCMCCPSKVALTLLKAQTLLWFRQDECFIAPVKLLWRITSGFGAHRVAGRQLWGEEQLFMATDSNCSLTSVQTQSTEFLGTTHTTRHNVQKCMFYFYTQIHYTRLGRDSSCKQPVWLQIQSWKLEFLYAENSTTARAYFYPGSSYSDFCWLHHSLKIMFFWIKFLLLNLRRKVNSKICSTIF